MYSRIINPPQNKSFFLFGPRGTGKTTWVKKTFPDSLYLDLLEAELFNDLLANPQRLEKYIPVNFNNFIIIDEIQRIPELLYEVHRLIENRRLKFILTGSNGRKLKRKGPNLLAGRALIYYLYPLTVIELGKDFSLNKSLLNGHLPSVFSEENPKKYLESYVKAYLEEEIKEEGLVRNLSFFSRFLEAASFSQGQVLNVSEVAREAGVERKVVSNYFSILEDLLIGVFIPVFNKRAKRRLIFHPKFYFFDVGVYRTIRPVGPFDLESEIEGMALETLVLQELRAVNDYFDFGYRLYYWRTANGLEVDFVLYGKKGLFAFEIKRKDKIKNFDTKSLKIFQKDYPQAKCYLVYCGKRVMSDGKISILPIELFLKDLKKIIG